MTTTRLPKTITAGALLATPIPPVKWIIPGLLPAGLALFAGPSKAGKSWLTLWLCLQVAQGKSVWGREIRTENRAVFLAGRYTQPSARPPVTSLSMQKKTRNAHFADGKSRNWAGIGRTNRQFHPTYPDISLIVIDTLQKVRSCD